MSNSVHADWLSELLGRRVAEVQVAVIGEFSSRVDRLYVRFAETGPDDPASLVLKRPLEQQPSQAGRIGESFAIEARFLREYAHEVHLRLPHCWASSDSAIVLEDIAFQPFSWRDGASHEHMQAALAALAQLHATPAQAWIPSFADVQFCAQLAQPLEAAWASHAARFEQLLPGFARLGDKMAENAGGCWAALGDAQALLHGDAHLENLPLLDPGPGVVMMDWQGPRRGHGLFDVAWFLAMSLPVQRRRKEEQHWLTCYLGHPPDAGEWRLYLDGLVSRAAGIVSLTADWPAARFDDTGWHWVFERCLTGVLDHRNALGRV